jgi:hypothetical protein
MFNITNLPYFWYCNGSKGMFEDGLTVNDEPMARHRSDLAPS